LIKAAPVTIQLNISARDLWIELALARRVIVHINEYKRGDRGELEETVRERACRTLEGLLYVGGLYQIASASGEEEYQAVLHNFDEETGVALIGVCLSHNDREAATFSAHFGLEPGTIVAGEKETPCFIVVQVPKNDSMEPLAAVAIAMLGDDSWDKDTYSTPAWKKEQIFAAARKTLPLP
jgi:hypothetical protein